MIFRLIVFEFSFYAFSVFISKEFPKNERLPDLAICFAYTH